MQRLRGDHETVGCFFALSTEAVDLGAQGGEPIGFVAPQMRDPGQLRHRARRGQRGQRSHRRGQFADIVQVDVEAAVRLGAFDLEI